jgi:hypothetical protein
MQPPLQRREVELAITPQHQLAVQHHVGGEAGHRLDDPEVAFEGLAGGQSTLPVLFGEGSATGHDFHASDESGHPRWSVYVSYGPSDH